jgi:hypothetical protein
LLKLAEVTERIPLFLPIRIAEESAGLIKPTVLQKGGLVKHDMVTTKVTQFAGLLEG